MALRDVINRSKSSEPAYIEQTVQRLTEERDRARLDRDTARDAWDEALTAEATGEGTADATATAERALDAAQKVLLNKDAALGAAKSKLDMIRSAGRRSEAAENWNKAISLADARAKAAAQFMKEAEALGKSYRTLLEATEALSNALPTTPDPDAAVLLEPQVIIAVRQELLRCGFTWAVTWPWGIVNLPAFLPPFEGTPQIIRQWRDAALAKV